MASKAITIQDIARIAGVSKATVSRVLNNKPDVDPATRERILRIIDEQEFTPDIVATIQGGGRSRFVGVLVPTLRLPLIPEIIRGVAEIIESTTYELILYSIAHSEERSTTIDQVLSRKKKLISGLLAMLPGRAAYHLDELYDEGFPLVMIDDQVPPLKVPWVGVDNRQGAMMAVQHLIQLGHRRIGIIQGPLSYLVSHERYQGYCDALATAGIPLDPTLVLRGDFETAGGLACAREFFGMADPPTAIFSSNDHMAYGVLDAAKEMDVRIPEGIALVGFDDNAVSAHVYPPLTTIRQPFYEMGKEGISLLLSLIESTALEPISRSTFARPMKPDRTRIYLPTTLVVRASSGAPHATPVKDRN